MSNVHYDDCIRVCANSLFECLENKKKITLVLGNGLHFIQVLRRSEALKLVTALRQGLITTSDFQQLSGLSDVGRKTRDKLQVILKDRSVELAVSSLTPEDQEAYTWEYYERFRWRTLRALYAPISYFAVRYLLEKEAVSTIVTTNYDLYLDRLLRVAGAIRNACTEQHEWTHNDYYSLALHQPTGKLTFWKIHGDLAYFCWPVCGCVEKLPSEFCEEPPRQCVGPKGSWGRHFHDFNEIDDTHFIWIRDKLRKHFADTSDETGLILAIGFKGDYDPATGPRNDLAQLLVEADQRHNHVFTVVAPTTYVERQYSYLWDHLAAKGRAIQPPKDRPLEVADMVFHILRSVQPYFVDFAQSYMQERARLLRLSGFVFGE